MVLISVHSAFFIVPYKTESYFFWSNIVDRADRLTVRTEKVPLTVVSSQLKKTVEWTPSRTNALIHSNPTDFFHSLAITVDDGYALIQWEDKTQLSIQSCLEKMLASNFLTNSNVSFKNKFNIICCLFIIRITH